MIKWLYFHLIRKVYIINQFDHNMVTYTYVIICFNDKMFSFDHIMTYQIKIKYHDNNMIKWDPDMIKINNNQSYIKIIFYHNIIIIFYYFYCILYDLILKFKILKNSLKILFILWLDMKKIWSNYDENEDSSYFER